MTIEFKDKVIWVEKSGGPVATFLNTTAYMSIIDGTAFIWLPLNSIAAYAGTDGSSTPYRIEIKDSSGYYLKGFLGTEGMGEGLGDELFTNGGFATGDFTGWTTHADYSVVSNQAVWGQVSTKYLKQNLTNCYKKIIKYQYNLVAHNPEWGGPKPYMEAHSNGYDYYDGGNGVQTFYLTCKLDYGADWGILCTSTYTDTMDDFSAKQVTEGPATYSVHVVSAANGGTRNWTSMDGSFGIRQNKNLLYTVYIYAVP